MVNFSFKGGTPKNLKVFEEADSNVKKRTTLYRSVSVIINNYSLTI
jgi:hypothetical protein